MRLWLVRLGDGAQSVVIVSAIDREAAKRQAQDAFGRGPFRTGITGSPDGYVVEPITREGDHVSICVTLA